jgi:hypothetical protein
MNKLMKRANQYKLPILVAHPSSSKKRQGYMAFVERLRHVLRMVPELGDVLAYYPKLGEPETKEANQALFDLLIAFCDHYLTAMLEQRAERRK